MGLGGTWWGLGGTYKFNSIIFYAQRTPLDLSEERRPNDEDSDSDDAVDLSRGHQPAPLSSDGREDLKLKSWRRRLLVAQLTVQVVTVVGRRRRPRVLIAVQLTV